ncbi:factor VII-activating protease-like [Branchiostoma floridae x Branchiostoma belcheri]
MAAAKTLIWAFLCLAVYSYVVVEGQGGGSRVTTPAVTTTTTQAEPCDSNPCQHGGECFDNDAGYFCNCPADWQGDNCEKSESAYCKH